MSVTKLLLGGEAFLLPSLVLRQCCTIFVHNPPSSRYEVQSQVHPDLFRTFLSALNGAAVEVTKHNIGGLSALCGEFGFNFSNPIFGRSRIATLEAEVAKLRSASEAVQADQATLATKTESMETNFPEIFAEFRQSTTLCGNAEGSNSRS
jgi:hypothetical protein